MSDLTIELERGEGKADGIIERVDDDGGLARRRTADRVPNNVLGLSQDEAVLAGFGKKQQLTRRFKSLSTLGLAFALMFTWLASLGTIQIGLVNGGPAGLLWGFLGAFTGAMLQALVMGEIASMIPLAGGAFNWVAVLSPPKTRRFLSYLAGWFTVITYQVFVLAICYGSASVTQAVVEISIPTYEPKLWHATLMSYAVALFGFFVNSSLGRVLPQVEALVFILIILVYFAVLITLVYLSPHRAPSDVFTTFLSLGGWENSGVTFLVGWTTSVGSFIGAEGADHIAEEVHSAATVVPFSMWAATLLNGIMGFGLLIAVMFVTGDYVAAATSSTGWAFIEIFQSSLGSIHGAAALTSIIIAVDIMSVSSCMATASRSLWAFARENGVPFSKTITKLNPKTGIPINALLVTLGVEMVLSLISIGSTTAFTAFYSVVLAASFSTFLIPACVMLHKRLTTPRDQIPWGPFRLGRLGLPINILAIIYTIVTLFFSFFPGSLPVTPTNMNYSILIYGAALLVMLCFWFLHGRNIYVGPVWELEGEYLRRR